VSPDHGASAGARPGHNEPRIRLRAATTLNMLSMIGAGPFLTIPLIVQSMQGPQSLIAWIAGATVAMADGLVWAELGAALPRSGGGYRYLLEAYGPRGLGRLMSFLFLWQTVIAFPLMMASGAVGFANYLQYLVPSLGYWQLKGVAVLICLLAAVLVYRRIDRVGRWGTLFGALVLVAIGWVILEGVLHGRVEGLRLPAGGWGPSRAFWAGLAGATLYSVYDYLGYNNICSYAGEVHRPASTIPRSIVLSVLLVGALYLAMNVSILSAMPWQDAASSQYVVSDFIARLRPGAAATVMTWLILVTIFAAIFAAMTATSRIPYAAAVEGHFFAVFGRLHPTGQFPHVSVGFMGVASALACLLELDALITSLMAIYVVIGALPIIGAVTALRRRADVARPFSMWGYPLPSLVAASGWIFILVTSGIAYIAAGVALLAVGVAAYVWRARRSGDWPFSAPPDHQGGTRST
jgi:amino acid transporter